MFLFYLCIRIAGRSLLFEYDTDPDDENIDKSQQLMSLLNELDKSIKLIKDNHNLIIQILEEYKNEKIIDSIFFFNLYYRTR